MSRRGYPPALFFYPPQFILVYNVNMKKKKLTIGILAHVDAGKTTLAEALLYETGAIRKLGRVDHGDSFLDTDAQERERGITIFSKQAELEFPGAEVMLMDTPGHVDFSTEAERVMGVLDYGILVISGKDGVQGHTATLWKLLEKYKIPTFIFVNKMDLVGTDKTGLMTELKGLLDDGCVECEAAYEELAMCDERLLDELLKTGELRDESIAKAIAERKIFPCCFGSALKSEGVSGLISLMDRFMLESGRDSEKNGSELETGVYKITRDRQGERLTHMKILNGSLRVRDEINGEKINQIRVYSGEKFRRVDVAEPGMICAVTGLSKSRIEGEAVLEPVLTYGMILPESVSEHEAYLKIKQLEEEDPLLDILWHEHLKEIQIKVMGEIQLEVLQNLIATRYGIDVKFGEGRIAYKETIGEAVTGSGHFEPLRHYAEVHLLMEPLERGSGMEYGTKCSHEEPGINWQRLIRTHLSEREHVGTLTGAPVTDLKISVLGGRAHDRHTEGGDFRQATYRAVRQGLRKALAAGHMILLEPWYEFELELPQEMVGRAMSDVQRMGGEFRTPRLSGTEGSGVAAVLSGRAPVSEMKDYITEVASYTKGYGRLTCSPCGYDVCHNSDEIVAASGYDADSDMANTADSVFCSNGVGYNVAWDEADAMMHMALGHKGVTGSGNVDEVGDSINSGGGINSGGELKAVEDEELQRIFERTFTSRGGKSKSERRRSRIEARELDSEESRKRKPKETEALRKYLLVDGYNVIFGWDELKELAKVNIDGAREALIDILCNYRGVRECEVIAVFDAYRVKGGESRTETHENITVVYTGEAETADTYIERMTYELSDVTKNHVRVVTSDRLEQLIITGNNAHKVSVDDFKAEVEQVNVEISERLARLARQNEIKNSNKPFEVLDNKQI